MLFYFDDNFYKSALDWFAENTVEDGWVLIGADWAMSTESYYNVYQKKGDALVNKEFAFSLDCICPLAIVPWDANYDDDRQTADLMKYIGIIRNDKEFMEEFYSIHDADRKLEGVCPRNEDGNYGVLDPSVGPYEVWVKAAKFIESQCVRAKSKGG